MLASTIPENVVIFSIIENKVVIFCLIVNNMVIFCLYGNKVDGFSFILNMRLFPSVSGIMLLFSDLYNSLIIIIILSLMINRIEYGQINTDFIIM